MLSDLRIRLRALFKPRAMDADLNDEVSFHLEREVEKLERGGLSRDEATRQARLAFGGSAQISENCREARGIGLLETTANDVRYGLRGWINNPGAFAIAALTLAVGIGAGAAVFTLVDTILLKPLPYPNAARIVMLWRTGPLVGIGDFPESPRELRILLDGPKPFQKIGAFKKESFNLTGTGDPELVEGVRASADLFATLGVAPALGRTFTADEDRPGNEHVVVLSHRLWQTRFGGSSEMVGQSIDLNGMPYTVLGVMPAGFDFPNVQGIPPLLDLPRETALWVPMALPGAPFGPNEIGVIGLVGAGTSMARVEQEMGAYETRLDAVIPTEKGWSSHLVPLAQQAVSGTRRPLLLLFGAVSVVLLIACANVAGLLLNRSIGRRRELTLRVALGATRGRLIRQLLTESLMLALLAGALGIAFGSAVLAVARRVGPAEIPHLHEAGLDWNVLSFTLGITLLAGTLCGMVPALGATRLAMAEALRESTQRSGGGAAAPRLRNVLMIAQVSMALVLVVAAGLLVRTFYSMLHAGAGFDAERVVTFELPLPTPKYAGASRMAAAYHAVLERLRALPGVSQAGLVSIVPMAGQTDGTAIRLPGHAAFDRSEQPYANYSFASPGYFASIGTPIFRGRDFTENDTLDQVHVAIINGAMARKYFPGQDPVGKQVGVAATRYPVRTIVGVVGDIKHASLKETPDPEMFVPYTQNEIGIWPSMQTMEFAVRTRGDAGSIADEIREAVSAVDPQLPVAKFSTLTALVNESISADRFALVLMGSFGLLALGLASIGMYGVISYSVLQRTPEIGVRMALGAQRGQIFAMVIRQAGRLAAAGIALGLIAAFAAMRLMSRFLYGVQATDPATFGAVALLLVAVVFLACWIPARRATRIDPLIALRYE